MTTPSCPYLPSAARRMHVSWGFVCTDLARFRANQSLAAEGRAERFSTGRRDRSTKNEAAHKARWHKIISND